MGMTPTARLARDGDLDAMIRLFDSSEVSRVATPDRAGQIWRDTLIRDGVFVFVSDASRGVVATCMLVVAPNLLREGRQHGFIENVVTHPDFRGQGYGSAVVDAALNQAWQLDCHHVMMQSGRRDPRVRAFYERAGFVADLRTAYVAVRPAERRHDRGHGAPAEAGAVD